MTNLAFNDIRYLGFGVLESGGDYTVRSISDSNAPKTALLGIDYWLSRLVTLVVVAVTAVIGIIIWRRRKRI